MSRSSDHLDVAVVGGGATGFASALAAAAAGLRTVLFAPASSVPPARTAALLQGSVDLLSDLGVWPPVADRAAALTGIRLVDATRRLIRAPETLFHARELGLPAFGFNVPNGALVEALRRHAETVANLTVVPAHATSVRPDDDQVVIESADAAFVARVAVAADGMRSLAREAAGISVRQWSYRQSALVAILKVGAPHGGVSTEFHTENGPLTLVPLPGDRVSLVWVDRPENSESALALPDDAFARTVEERTFSIHGAMQLEGRPALFPLGAALAARFAARRIMLVGEAAHLFPPTGAQGLNLGFRDVAALRRVLSRHRLNPGSDASLAAYHAARRADVRSRALAVDLLNRSLLTDFLPVQAARSLGLAAAALPAVRHAMMRHGMAARPEQVR